MEQTHAVVENGFVVNVVVADQAFMDKWYPGSVDITGMDPMPGIGWAYDGTTFKPPEPELPPIPIPKPPIVVFSTQGFRARYTLDELIAVDNCDSNASIKPNDKKRMNTINTSVIANDTINITHQNVIDAVNFEAQIGLITQARADQILDPGSPAPVGAWQLD
jgi:hypothetical protein